VGQPSGINFAGIGFFYRCGPEAAANLTFSDRSISYFVRSAAVGGPSTQLTSQAVSTVMKVREPAGSQASCTIFAGM